MLAFFTLCWLFGHRWSEGWIVQPASLTIEEKNNFPGGYQFKKCVLCNKVDIRPLV